MNLANSLTALRILLTPISIIYLFSDIPHQELIAAGFFILAGLTDGLDGWAARVRKETTHFGKSFDPFADKVLVTSALFSLAKLNYVPWWMVWVIIGREVAVTILRQVAGRRGLSVGASQMGKAKTASQIVAVTAIILWAESAAWMLWIALVLSVASGFDYVLRWRGAFSRQPQTSSLPS